MDWINPRYLVTEGTNNKIEGFFVGLGVIFNDLKGLILFEKILLDHYEKPENDEISSHAGSYGGVLVQTQKLFAGTINEFFIFLKKSAEVFEDQEFKEVFEKLAKSDQSLWRDIIAVANGEMLDATDFLKTLVKIRSNVAFHYDHSKKILRNAYVSRFFGETHDNKTDHAYFSIGNTIETTRFYFADAAVEESLSLAAGKRPKEDDIANAPMENYRGQVRETIDVMSAAIASLMKKYIQSRRNRPHLPAKIDGGSRL